MAQAKSQVGPPQRAAAAPHLCQNWVLRPFGMTTFGCRLHDTGTQTQPLRSPAQGQTTRVSLSAQSRFERTHRRDPQRSSIYPIIVPSQYCIEALAILAPLNNRISGEE